MKLQIVTSDKFLKLINYLMLLFVTDPAQFGRWSDQTCKLWGGGSVDELCLVSHGLIIEEEEKVKLHDFPKQVEKKKKAPVVVFPKMQHSFV